MGDDMKPSNVEDIRQRVEERKKKGPPGYQPPDEKKRGGDNGGSGGGAQGGVTSTFVMECLDANEAGDGILYAALHKGRFVHNMSSGEWYRWAEHHWALDVEQESRAAVEWVAQRYLQEAHSLVGKIDWAIKAKNKEQVSAFKARQAQIYRRVKRLRSFRGGNNVLQYAKNNVLNPLIVTGDKIDQQDWLLPCPDAVIDLRTGEPHDGRPDEHLLKATEVSWADIEAPAPEWEHFLDTTFEGDQEIISYLRRLFGYAMTGSHREHVLPILWGRGRNGKSTIVETISHVLGPLSGPIPTEMLLSQSYSKNASGPTPEIMALRGQRMVFAAETDEDRRFSPAKIKWLSGGDSLVGRAPHDRYQVEFRPTHTLFLLTNNKPHAPADDFAFWERVHLIPFNLSFVDREPAAPHERRADKTLAERLRTEASGIIAWLVRGCIEWQNQGLDPPDKVKEATETYKREEDLLADWIDECCYLDPASDAGASDLYDSFKEWWSDNVSKRTPSQKKFGKWMSNRFRREKRGTYIYYGIRVLSGGV